MNASTRKIGALAATMWLLLAGLTAPVAASGAGNQVVTAGNVVYQTDSGLEVTDTAGNAPSGNPFTDRYTLELSGLTLSAAGNAPATVTIDQRSGTETALSDIDTSSTDVTVDPDGTQAAIIGGSFQTLTYMSPSFEVAGADEDFDYEADGTASLTYPDSGLADGTTVEAIDTGDGDVLDTAAADATGRLGFTALSAGSYTVNVSQTDTQVPVAATGADVTVDEDTSVSFDGSGSTDDGTIASYEWDWTGDGSYEGSGQTASHTYADPGTYTATLRVTDGAGQTDSDTRTVTVRDTTPPTASTQSDTTVDEGDAVSFDASGSTDNGAIASYEWDWTGDGSYEGSGSTPTHTYADPGTYTVTLRVTDGGGNTDTAQRTVTVEDTGGGGGGGGGGYYDNTPPTAATQPNVTVDAGTAVTFDGGNSTDNDEIDSHDWDFDGDGSYEASGTTVSRNYTDSGTYTVTLRVTDNYGNADTARRTVTVENTTAPTARTQPNVTVDAGTPVTFNATESTDDGNSTTYQWDFDGDGTYDDSGVVASYNYTEAGTYNTTLQVTDGDGNTDTARRTVTVERVGSDGSDGDGGDGTATPEATVTPTATPPATPSATAVETANPADGDTATPESTTGGGGPLSPVLAVLAIVGALLVRRRYGGE